MPACFTRQNISMAEQSTILGRVRLGLIAGGLVGITWFTVSTIVGHREKLGIFLVVDCAVGGALYGFVIGILEWALRRFLNRI